MASLRPQAVSVIRSCQRAGCNATFNAKVVDYEGEKRGVCCSAACARHLRENPAPRREPGFVPVATMIRRVKDVALEVSGAANGGTFAAMFSATDTDGTTATHVRITGGAGDDNRIAHTLLHGAMKLATEKKYPLLLETMASCSASLALKSPPAVNILEHLTQRASPTSRDALDLLWAQMAMLTVKPGDNLLVKCAPASTGSVSIASAALAKRDTLLGVHVRNDAFAIGTRVTIVEKLIADVSRLREGARSKGETARSKSSASKRGKAAARQTSFAAALTAFVESSEETYVAAQSAVVEARRLHTLLRSRTKKGSAFIYLSWDAAVGDVAVAADSVCAALVAVRSSSAALKDCVLQFGAAFNLEEGDAVALPSRRRAKRPKLTAGAEAHDSGGKEGGSTGAASTSAAAAISGDEPAAGDKVGPQFCEFVLPNGQPHGARLVRGVCDELADHAVVAGVEGDSDL